MFLHSFIFTLWTWKKWACGGEQMDEENQYDPLDDDEFLIGEGEPEEEI
jgi:hypothetical protein